MPYFPPNFPLSQSFWGPNFPLRHLSNIAILGHCNVVNKFNTSRQYSSMLLFFLNIVTYFVLSKQIWILYDQLFLEFPYEGKSLSASLQHRRPNSYLHKEILRRKKSNFGRRVFIFVLPIQNKSPFGFLRKNNNFLQNWKDVVKFIDNMAETQNRDANDLRWQICTSLGNRVSGPDYRKMEHGKTLWWGCCLKKNVKTIVSKGGHPSFKSLSLALLWVLKRSIMKVINFGQKTFLT